MSFDVIEMREHFPILDEQVNGQRLTYLDNAASSLKPKEVAETIYRYYLYESSNIHRGAHYLSRKGTERYEAVRKKVAEFIGSPSAEQIVFTRGVTESINLFMYSYAMENCSEGDVILLTAFEHHSNVVPWHLLRERKGCIIKVLPYDHNGKLDFDAAEKIFKNNNVKIVSLLMYSNVTGVRLDVESAISLAKKYSAVTLVDSAQAMLHEKINVSSLDCDFLTFSAHKMLGPYGIGVLYGRKSILDKMHPFHGGGSMISQVSWDKVVYQNTPHKFEAGTPSIPEVLGLGTAIDFIEKYNLDSWNTHQDGLLIRLQEILSQKKQVQMYIPEKPINRSAILSFSYMGAHASDVGEILDQSGVAVRAGHHCAQPLMSDFNVSGTVRVSFAPYNNDEDLATFLKAFKKVEEIL